MLLFEIVGRRRNTRVGGDKSLDWFPKHVWNEFEKGKLGEMTLLSCGIEENNRENGNGSFVVCSGLAPRYAADECCSENVGGRSGGEATS
ncbi:unnamed protein product [Camellia sinensis]